MGGTYTIGVVGNPNCGKTTLFNVLTGAKQYVGNWPGVTVERKVGQFRCEKKDFELVDLPGTYSLDVTDREVSLDEQIARDYVHAREADLIVNILDASNLERNLYLTTQLVEMRVPLLVVLNMVDVVAEKGMRIDAAGLASRLGCPVLPVVASRGTGIEALKRALLEAVEQKPIPTAEIRYDTVLENAITALVPKLSLVAERNGDSPRWLAVRLLEGDDLARELVGDAVSETALKAVARRFDRRDRHLARGRPLWPGPCPGPGHDRTQGQGLHEPLRPHRPGYVEQGAWHTDLSSSHVPDVHVHHQHRRRLHRLLRHPCRYAVRGWLRGGPG